MRNQLIFNRKLIYRYKETTNNVMKDQLKGHLDDL